MRKLASAILPLMLFIIAAESNTQTRIRIDLSKKEYYRQRLSSTNLEERMVAASYFAAYPPEALDSGLMKEIIDLLLKEEDHLNRIRKELGLLDNAFYDRNHEGNEDAAIYILDLLKIVGKSGDQRLLPLHIKYGTQPTELVGYGEETALLFLDRLEKSLEHRAYYIHCLGYWIIEKKEGYTARGILRDQIKNMIIESVQTEKEYASRFAAVAALMRIQDEDIIPILKKISTSDPWHYIEGLNRPTDEISAPGAKVLRYPIRELAQRELAKRTK